MTMFQKFLSHVLKAPKLIAVIIVFLFALTFATVRGLRVDLFPPLNFPILNIITEIPSFSSLEMERQITLPIESTVSGVLGVTKVRSTSATGISMVSVEFQWGTDMLIARQLLIESLSALRSQLPTDADPTIENLSATLSLIEGYSLQGGQDLVSLRDTATYQLKPRLQQIPGVYKVIVMGGRVLEYTVRPNPYLMIKYDIALDNLKDALANNNILATPGVVNNFSQELVLYSNGQFGDESEIGSVVLAVKNGIPIRVRDVAKVLKTFQYERGDTSENGSPSVIINILKQPNFDTGVVAGAIRGEIAKFEENLPKGFTIHNYYDQAQLVQDSVSNVKESVWIGALLVVAVLAGFLRHIKTTFIAILSIPISVATALVLMRLFGIGLNIMSLGGLAIGTGIIVDDTIVVLENIFRWLSTPELKGGLSNMEVILKATSEVLVPVIVSTLANIAIFVPMVFVEGFAGRLFAPVSWTVTFALLASLVVALTVIPTLAHRWLADVNLQHEEEAWYRLYKPPLNMALKRPAFILALALVPILCAAVVFKRLDTEFLPALDEGAILLQTVMPPGVSVNEAMRLNLKIENWLKAIPGVTTVVRRTGHAPGAEDTDNVNHSDIMLKLAPKNQRPVPLDDFIDQLKSKTSPLASVQANYLMPLADKINDALGGVPADLGVDLFGPDLNVLHQYGETLIGKMKSIPGIADLRPPSDIPVPSLQIKIDRKEAGRLGINEKSVYDLLQAYSIGLPATSIRLIQKEIRVILHFSLNGQNLDIESLQSLPLKTAGGSTVPLEQVAQLTYGEIPSEVNHEHLTRKLTITANAKDRNTDSIAQDVQKAITDLKLPASYSWSFSGKYKTEQSAMKNMAMVLGLAVFIVALILWLEFRSWTQVFLILLTLPLAAIGAVFSLWVCHETVNVSSMIGAVMLVGIVVRNGIMLLDYMNLQLEGGLALKEAVYSAAMKRVRPILMTASVTVLGLLPLALGWGTGSELQRPLAIAVIGGMVTSTLLTLVVLPSATLFMMGLQKRHSSSQQAT